MAVMKEIAIKLWEKEAPDTDFMVWLEAKEKMANEWLFLTREARLENDDTEQKFL